MAEQRAPERSLRPCAKAGCPNLVRPPERYCDAHAHLARHAAAESQRHYDEHVRDQQARDFYRSGEWKRTRLAVLMRDHYLCQECLRRKRITIAHTVHHLVPLREAWGRRLDLTNLESVCAACHNTLREQGKE